MVLGSGGTRQLRGHLAGSLSGGAEERPDAANLEGGERFSPQSFLSRLLQGIPDPGPLTETFRSLSRERSPHIFFEALFQIAQQQEQSESGLGLATAIYASMWNERRRLPPGLARRTRERLDAIEGRGAVLPRLGFHARHFAHHALDPVSIAAMGLAGPVFQVARAGALGRLAVSPVGRFLGRAGTRALASTLAFGAEATAFTGTIRLGNALMGREQDWSARGIWHEFAGGAITLLGLKLTGAIAGHAVQRWGQANTPAAGLARAVFPQVGMYSGILASHRLEELLEFRPPAADSSMRYFDALATLLQFHVGGKLAHEAVGRHLAGMSRMAEVQAAALSRQGTTPSPLAGGPHRPPRVRGRWGGGGEGTRATTWRRLWQQSRHLARQAALAPFWMMMGAWGDGGGGIRRALKPPKSDPPAPAQPTSEIRPPQILQRLSIDAETLKRMEAFPEQVRQRHEKGEEPNPVFFGLNHLMSWMGMVQRDVGERGAEALVRSGQILFGRFQENVGTPLLPNEPRGADQAREASTQQRVAEDLRAMADASNILLTQVLPTEADWWRPAWERGIADPQTPIEALARMVQELRNTEPELAEAWLEELAGGEFDRSEAIREQLENLSDGPHPSDLPLSDLHLALQGGNFLEANRRIAEHYRQALERPTSEETVGDILTIQRMVQEAFRFRRPNPPSALDADGSTRLHHLSPVAEQFHQRVEALLDRASQDRFFGRNEWLHSLPPLAYVEQVLGLRQRARELFQRAEKLYLEGVEVHRNDQQSTERLVQLNQAMELYRNGIWRLEQAQGLLETHGFAAIRLKAEGGLWTEALSALDAMEGGVAVQATALSHLVRMHFDSLASNPLQATGEVAARILQNFQDFRASYDARMPGEDGAPLRVIEYLKMGRVLRQLGLPLQAEELFHEAERLNAQLSPNFSSGTIEGSKRPRSDQSIKSNFSKEFAPRVERGEWAEILRDLERNRDVVVRHDNLRQFSALVERLGRREQWLAFIRGTPTESATTASPTAAAAPARVVPTLSATELQQVERLREDLVQRLDGIRQFLERGRQSIISNFPQVHPNSINYHLLEWRNLVLSYITLGEGTKTRSAHESFLRFGSQLQTLNPESPGFDLKILNYVPEPFGSMKNFKKFSPNNSHIAVNYYQETKTGLKRRNFSKLSETLLKVDGLRFNPVDQLVGYFGMAQALREGGFLERWPTTSPSSAAAVPTAPAPSPSDSPRERFKTGIAQWAQELADRLQPPFDNKVDSAADAFCNLGYVIRVLGDIQNGNELMERDFTLRSPHLPQGSVLRQTNGVFQRTRQREDWWWKNEVRRGDSWRDGVEVVQSKVRRGQWEELEQYLRAQDPHTVVGIRHHSFILGYLAGKLRGGAEIAQSPEGPVDAPNAAGSAVQATSISLAASAPEISLATPDLWNTSGSPQGDRLASLLRPLISQAQDTAFDGEQRVHILNALSNIAYDLGFPSESSNLRRSGEGFYHDVYPGHGGTFFDVDIRTGATCFEGDVRLDRGLFDEIETQVKAGRIGEALASIDPSAPAVRIAYQLAQLVEIAAETGQLQQIRRVILNDLDRLPVRDINTIPEDHRHWIPQPRQAPVAFPRFQQALEEVASLMRAPDRIAVRIFGPPGTGKTTIPEVIAARMNTPLLRFPFSRRTDPSDFEGTWRMEIVGSERVPVFEEGPATLAMEHGYHLVLDEPDLARPGALAFINNITAPGERAWVRRRGGQLESIPVHRDYRVIATENGMREVSREEHGPDFLRRFVPYHFGTWNQAEVTQVLTERFGRGAGGPSLDSRTIELLASLHHTVSRLAEGMQDPGTRQPLPPLGSGVGQQVQFTPRSVLRLAQRLVASGALTQQTLSRAIRSEYILPLADATDRDLVWGQARAIFAPLARAQAWAADAIGPEAIATPTLEQLSQRYLGGRPVPRGSFVWTPQALRLADEMLWNRSLGIDVFLLGEAGEGKTVLPPEVARLLHAEYFLRTVSSETDTEDLTGGPGRGPNGELTFVPDIVTVAVDREGPTVLHLDEYLLADTGKLESVMNPLMDDARALILQNPYRRIPRRDLFLVFSSNPDFGTYQDRNQHSGAAMSRPAVIYLTGDFGMSPADRQEILSAWAGRTFGATGGGFFLPRTPRGGGTNSRQALAAPRFTLQSPGSGVGEVHPIAVHPELVQRFDLPPHLVLRFEEGHPILSEPAADGSLGPLSSRTAAALQRMSSYLTRRTQAEMATTTGRVFRIQYHHGEEHLTDLVQQQIHMGIADLLEHGLLGALGLGKHEYAHAAIDRGSERYDSHEPGRLFANAAGDPRMNEYVMSLRQDFAAQIHEAWDHLWPREPTQGQMEHFGALLPHEQFAYAIIHVWRHGEFPPWLTDSTVREALDEALPILRPVFHLFPESAQDPHVDRSAAEFYQILDRAWPSYERLIPESLRQLMERMERGESEQDLQDPFAGNSELQRMMSALREAAAQGQTGQGESGEGEGEAGEGGGGSAGESGSERSSPSASAAGNSAGGNESSAQAQRSSGGAQGDGQATPSRSSPTEIPESESPAQAVRTINPSQEATTQDASGEPNQGEAARPVPVEPAASNSAESKRAKADAEADPGQGEPGGAENQTGAPQTTGPHEGETPSEREQRAQEILERRAGRMADLFEPRDPLLRAQRQQEIAQARAGRRSGEAEGRSEATPAEPGEISPRPESDPQLSEQERLAILDAQQRALRSSVQDDLFRRLVPIGAIQAARRLQRVLPPENPSYMEGFFSSGKRIDRRRAVQDAIAPLGNGRVMLRRLRPGERDVDVVILSDVSGSMQSAQENTLRASAAAVYLTEQLKMNYGEIFFSTEVRIGKPLGRPLNTYGRKNALLHEKIRAFQEISQNTNIRGPLAMGLDWLQARGSRTKIVILITDGQENVFPIRDTLPQLQERADREGVHLVVIAMGAARRYVPRMFRNHREASDDGGDLPDVIVDLIEEAHQRRYR